MEEEDPHEAAAAAEEEEAAIPEETPEVVAEGAVPEVVPEAVALPEEAAAVADDQSSLSVDSILPELSVEVVLAGESEATPPSGKLLEVVDAVKEDAPLKFVEEPAEMPGKHPVDEEGISKPEEEDSPQSPKVISFPVFVIVAQATSKFLK